MRRLLALCVTLVTAAACGDQTTTPSVGAEAFNLRAENVLIGARTQMFREGVMTAEMVADSAYKYDDERPMDLIGVQATFFTEQGAQAGTLTSETGNYDITNKVFVARGNVVLITGEANGGRQLETEELHFNVEQDELWTDVPFTVVEDGRTTTGTSFRSDSKFQTWHVTGATSQGRVGSEGGIRF